VEFDTLANKKNQKRCIFSPELLLLLSLLLNTRKRQYASEFPINFKVGNGTIDVRGHQAACAV